MDTNSTKIVNVIVKFTVEADSLSSNNERYMQWKVPSLEAANILGMILGMNGVLGYQVKWEEA